jgi:serine/threonine-protein kinase RsbW
VRVERDVAVEPDGLSILHEVMEAYWDAAEESGCPHVNGRWRALFDSAVAEIAANIVRHAYSESRGEEMFRITLQCFGDRMEAVLLDQGLPFDLALSARPPDMRGAVDDLELEHGWGLPIAQAASDSLHYERLASGYNRWRLDKRLP